MNKHRDNDFLLKFGKHLKELREKKGFTQEQLANIADISDNQVARIERGEINTTICTLKVISKALGINLSDLFKF